MTHKQITARHSGALWPGCCSTHWKALVLSLLDFLQIRLHSVGLANTPQSLLKFAVSREGNSNFFSWLKLGERLFIVSVGRTNDCFNKNLFNFPIHQKAGANCFRLFKFGLNLKRFIAVDGSIRPLQHWQVDNYWNIVTGHWSSVNSYCQLVSWSSQ